MPLNDMYDERTTPLREVAMQLREMAKLPGYCRTSVDELRSELASIIMTGEDSLAPELLVVQLEGDYEGSDTPEGWGRLEWTGIDEEYDDD